MSDSYLRGLARWSHNRSSFKHPIQQQLLLIRMQHLVLFHHARPRLVTVLATYRSIISLEAPFMYYHREIVQDPQSFAPLQYTPLDFSGLEKPNAPSPICTVLPSKLQSRILTLFISAPRNALQVTLSSPIINGSAFHGCLPSP